MPHPLSIQMYTVRELAKADYFGTLRQIAEIGYDAIEGGPPQGTSDEDFKKFLDDAGLRVSSNWANPTKENLSQVVDRANLFGYQFITMGFWIPDFATPEALQKAADKLKAAAELIGPHGLQLCVHNHWFEFDTVDGQLNIDRLLQLAGPKLAYELDIYWASNFGAVDVPAYIKQHKSRIPLMHVKDGTLIKDQPQLAVGSGKNDIAGCLNAADPNVLKYLVVELDDYVGGHANMMEAVRESHRWLTDRGFASRRR